MLIERYNYTPLDRQTTDVGRVYVSPDGKKLPSVTTILDKTKPQESKDALARWKKSVGEKKAQQITTEAASRGTRMHSYLEHYIKDGTLRERGSNPYSWASHAMAKTVIDSGLINVSEFWGIEIPLYFPGIYAGTTDGVGIHCGIESILDYKQSNKPKKREWIDDYFLQLCAYAEAHNSLHGTNIRKGVILMCVKPEIDSKFNITGQPQYQEFVIEGQEFELYRQHWWKRVEQYYTNCA